MRGFILEIIVRVLNQILSAIWFFVRPVFYLYLIWGGMKVMSIFSIEILK